MSEEAIKAADALGAAMNARSVDAIRAIYADDITVWHGSTNQALSKDENVGLLGGVFAISSSLEYVNIQRYAIDDGIVQQHCLKGVFDNGQPMPDLYCCLVIKVRDGKIVRIDEYFDGSVFAEVWERLAAVADN